MGDLLLITDKHLILNQNVIGLWSYPAEITLAFAVPRHHRLTRASAP